MLERVGGKALMRAIWGGKKRNNVPNAIEKCLDLALRSPSEAYLVGESHVKTCEKSAKSCSPIQLMFSLLGFYDFEDLKG